jgi:hypothetical protein
MKLSVFENMIRKVVREEIDYALKREIKGLKESIQSSNIIKEETKPKTKKKTQFNSNGARRKKPLLQDYAKNPALNDLLNETALGASEWGKELNGGASANISQPFMTGDPLPTESLPEEVKSAVTRDYSGLMEAMDKR